MNRIFSEDLNQERINWVIENIDELFMELEENENNTRKIPPRSQRARSHHRYSSAYTFYNVLLTHPLLTTEKNMWAQ